MMRRRLNVAFGIAWLCGAAACGSSAGPRDGAAGAPATDAGGEAPASTPDGAAGTNGGGGAGPRDVAPDGPASATPLDGALDLSRPDSVAFDGRIDASRRRATRWRIRPRRSVSRYGARRRRPLPSGAASSPKGGTSSWGSTSSRMCVAQYQYEAAADAILTYYPNSRELLSYLRAP